MEYLDSAKDKLVDLLDSAEALVPQEPLVRYGAAAVVIAIYLFAPNLITDTPNRDVALDIGVASVVAFLLYPVHGALISLGVAAASAGVKMYLRGGIYM